MGIELLDEPGWDLWVRLVRMKAEAVHWDMMVWQAEDSCSDRRGTGSMAVELPLGID